MRVSALACSVSRAAAFTAPRQQAGYPQHLLVEVPRTAIPQDVLRALREVGAVDKSFSIDNITAVPLGAPATNFLTTTYHIRANEKTEEIRRVLSTRPMFAASSTRAVPAAGRPGLGIWGMKDRPRVFLCDEDARTWAESLLAKAATQRPLRAGAEWKPVDVDWALAPGLSGRRVLVQGLPRILAKGNVQKLAEAGTLAKDRADSCVELPPTRFSTSSWVLTLESVAAAHALVRRLNKNYFMPSKFGRDRLMRASVAW